MYVDIYAFVLTLYNLQILLVIGNLSKAYTFKDSFQKQVLDFPEVFAYKIA